MRSDAACRVRRARRGDRREAVSGGGEAVEVEEWRMAVVVVGDAELVGRRTAGMLFGGREGAPGWLAGWLAAAMACLLAGGRARGRTRTQRRGVRLRAAVVGRQGVQSSDGARRSSQ